MAVFTKVVETENFSEAARQLGQTPSAISKSISRLEDRLGVRLLDRSTRNVHPTEAGHAFYRRCVRILAEIDEAEQALSAEQAEPRGILRVSCAVAFANAQIARVVPEFMERYPAVHLELQLTDRAVNLVEEGIDIAIRTGDMADSAMVMRKIADDHQVICAAPDYLDRFGAPETPVDLKNHKCILLMSNRRRVNEWPFERADGSAYRIKVSGDVETDNAAMVYELCRQGHGLARVAESVLGPDVKKGRMSQVLEGFKRGDTVPIHAVYPHRRHLSPKVRAFVDFLVEKFLHLPPWKTDDGV